MGVDEGVKVLAILKIELRPVVTAPAVVFDMTTP